MRHLIVSFFSLISVLFLPSASLAQGDYSVGFSRLTADSVATGENVPMAIAYPTRTVEQPVKFGPFRLKLAKDAPIAEGQFPLVVVSHGSGGSSLNYRSIAFELARNGFVVAMPMHPGNNFQDNRHQGSLANLVNRPKHISAAIDAVVAYPRIKDQLKAGQVAVVGHSIGGYSALAAAGGAASTAPLVKLCQRSQQAAQQTPLCNSDAVRNETSENIQTNADKRIDALVLLAPVGVFFDTADALQFVKVPTLLMRAEHDHELPEPNHADVIAKRYASSELLTYQTVDNAGHYSFITPFPDFLKAELGPIAQDPDGFDRNAFHQKLGSQISDYLTSVLK